MQIKNLQTITIALIAELGGLLFGFDTGVISGAIPYFQAKFAIDDSWVEMITTAGLAGAVVGAMFGGRFADIFGRKPVILFATVIFVIGALWSGFAPSALSLVYARLFLGLAIGVSSFAVPLYIAEISPTKLRGRLVALFQLLITIGIMVSYFSDLAFALPEGAPGYNECWRPMFYIGVVPAGIMFLGMLFLPESPRWLISKGYEFKSHKVLVKIEGAQQASSILGTLKEELQLDKNRNVNWREIFKPWLRTPLKIAIGIMFIQQFTGINTIIYYSPKIFIMAGFNGARAAILASVSVGLITVIFTILSLFLIDKIGRRKLFFIGLAGMIVSLIALGSGFAFNSMLAGNVKYISIVLVWLYCAFFCISLGPLGWLIISEIFPLKVRGIGSSIGSLSNWLFNGLVAFSFFKVVRMLTLPGTGIVVDNHDLGNPAGAFWLYAFIGILGIIWGFYFIPETKGQSLEQIEENWRMGRSPRDLQKEK